MRIVESSVLLAESAAQSFPSIHARNERCFRIKPLKARNTLPAADMDDYQVYLFI